MCPFLSYSGRGRGHAGRCLRPGRGIAGRGVRLSTRDIPGGIASDHRYKRSNKWVRGGESKSNGQGKGSNTAVTTELEATKEKTTQMDMPKTKRMEVSSESPDLSKSGRVTDQGVPAAKISSHAIMTKRGHNRLVLSSKTGVRSETDGSGAAPEDQRPKRNLKRKGNHKLVSVSAPSSALERRNERQRSLTTKRSGCSDPQRKRKMATRSERACRPVAKRVKVSTSLLGTKEASDDLDSKASEGQVMATISVTANADAGKKRLEEKLTDFAYRETSRVRQRVTAPSQNRSWSKKKNNDGCTTPTNLDRSTSLSTQSRYPHNKNMGLVRVHPDLKKTPICPMFLKGIQCQNQYCRKRHDIPKEYAMPVCSFFQKHGQCLRRDTCMFRHVKVNPKAVVCPSFAVLGFCEDEKCPMQHVRVPKGKKNTNEDTYTMDMDRNGRSSFKTQSRPKNSYYRSK